MELLEYIQTITGIIIMFLLASISIRINDIRKLFDVSFRKTETYRAEKTIDQIEKEIEDRTNE